ncbi:MAG: acyl-CoA dehydrogenase family protein [Corynebacteriales bacterium]|uniref:Acyl-CoA dehydrogenase family protein n=1 Tax=Williamsia herbipolensis TaxID=1603258 RepID=A0AAU4K1U4_9NOCA|nr:acyl-CoA dehydrogenase family protein [Williamsia herbipolensis]MCX6469188.1 acyl-CoA dehydrogenase family protein [Mycobacteriales bacterium]
MTSTLTTHEVPRTQDTMSHDIWLPAEIAELRADARRAVEATVAPVARRIGSQEESVENFPWDAFGGLADAGMFAVPFDGPLGRGLHHRMLGTCTVTEEIAYHSSSMAGVYDGQCILVPQALSFATEYMQSQLLPQLISGEQAFSFATTEPDASSDLSIETLQTVATETDAGFVVNGRKRWITNSVVAKWAAVLVKTGQRMNMLLIDLTADGVRVGAPDLKMGHRGQITADIVLDNVAVPREHLLGTPGGGLSVALSCLTRGRIGIGAAGVGVAQAALDLAVHRLRTRQVFGGPLGRMQHWQFTLAQRATEIECARSLYQKAAMRLDLGDRAAEPEAAMAKAYGTRVAVDTVRDSLQIHGGFGFARQIAETGESVRLEELYRDAKILEIFEGANELQQWVIARNLIGRDVTG